MLAQMCLMSLYKGQIKPKADRRTLDSPKKRTDELVLFAFLVVVANKTNSFVLFRGESTARPNCFRFYLTFNGRAFYSCIKRPSMFPCWQCRQLFYHASMLEKRPNGFTKHETLNTIISE